LRSSARIVKAADASGDPEAMTAIAMIIVFLAAIAALNWREFGRID
jgi:hypothetical protein